jgi:hypothetical protein
LVLIRRQEGTIDDPMINAEIERWVVGRRRKEALDGTARRRRKPPVNSRGRRRWEKKRQIDATTTRYI